MTCTDNINACASKPCGNRTCHDLTPEEQAVNGTQGYRCNCLPEEISVNGLCLGKHSIFYILVFNFLDQYNGDNIVIILQGAVVVKQYIMNVYFSIYF